jgi:hypothetical protein
VYNCIEKKNAFNINSTNTYEKQFLRVALFVISSLYRGVEETVRRSGRVVIGLEGRENIHGRVQDSMGISSECMSS